MLNFEKLTVDHKEIMLPYLQKDGMIAGERNFASLYMWSEYYGTQACVVDDFCYIRTFSQESNEYKYCIPFGDGDLYAAVNNIFLHENKKELTFFCITDAIVDKVKEIFGENIALEESRDSFDYIYKSKDLSEFAGRKFSAKRNHINKFLKEYGGRWEYRKIDWDNDIEMLMAIQKKWCNLKESVFNESFDYEMDILKRGIQYHNELNILGGILLVDNQIAAYTIAAPINDNAISIIVEKGDTEIAGVYTVIVNKFANEICDQYEFVNREEDLGIEGLRKSKLSYYPEYLLKKYRGSVKI